jgi:hypothetical protein
MALETTPAQLLEGFTVGTRGTTHCQWCDHEFDEGHVAIVLFTQAVDTDRWDIHRTYCTPCNPSTIARPVLDCPKLLVQCRLGLCADSTTRPTKLVALEPKLIDSSGLAEGSRRVRTELRSRHFQRVSARPLLTTWRLTPVFDPRSSPSQTTALTNSASRCRTSLATSVETPSLPKR